MKLDVELVGGPMDGHTCEVEMDDPRFDVRLFVRCEENRREVLAYAFQGRTTAGGKRWVLGFLYAVAKVGSGKNPQERRGQ